jgi:hypothetical protein
MYAASLRQFLSRTPELQALATSLNGLLRPLLGWKYGRIRPIEAAKWARVTLPELKASLLRRWDKAMFLMTPAHRR